MRIIGGTLRGRRLQAPPGRSTRPMLDRVREAVFSTLQPWLPEARVLDLYAGSGSLGLEALSRGASRARLVESDPPALRLLRANVAALELSEQAEIVAGDALDPHHWSTAAGPPDVVFLDPPYAFVRDPRGRGRIQAAVTELCHERLAPEGVLVLHVPRDLLGEADLAPSLAVRERSYGTSAILYAQPEPLPEVPGSSAPPSDGEEA